jgi:hypothetical protein
VIVSKRTKAYRSLAGIALVGAGAAAGAILALTSAARPSPSTRPRWADAEPGHWPHGGWPERDLSGLRATPAKLGLVRAGTVTAVGTSTVTIRTSTGTSTYAVEAGHEIDNLGAAAGRALKVGDGLEFSTTSASDTITILQAIRPDAGQAAPARRRPAPQPARVSGGVPRGGRRHPTVGAPRVVPGRPIRHPSRPGFGTSA